MCEKSLASKKKVNKKNEEKVCKKCMCLGIARSKDSKSYNHPPPPISRRSPKYANHPPNAGHGFAALVVVTGSRTVT